MSRREQSAEKTLTTLPEIYDGVLKSHSANALHPKDHPKDQPKEHPKDQEISNTKPLVESRPKIEDSQETIQNSTASTDTIVAVKQDNFKFQKTEQNFPLPILRQQSEVIIPTLSRFMAENPGYFERSLSAVESGPLKESEVTAKLSERAERIRAAREKFLSSTTPMRREGTSSASDLRPVDR